MREWLMRLIAGKRVYWVSDKVAKEFKDFSGTTASNAAALVLAKTMEQIKAAQATYTIDGWEISIKRSAIQSENEKENDK